MEFILLGLLLLIVSVGISEKPRYGQRRKGFRKFSDLEDAPEAKKTPEVDQAALLKAMRRARLRYIKGEKDD